mmetsp:Transcript_18584/g.34411  ORF Transcript_18584/g.34411 Transcript_18584/m.34411 type:complete len:247 (+) Transcript_18584:751-1491(+)
MFVITTTVVLLALPAIRAKRMIVPLLFLRTKLCNRILAKPSRQHLSYRVVRMAVALTRKLFEPRHPVERFLQSIRRARHSVQTKVFGRLMRIVAVVHVHLALQPGKARGTGAVHSILLLLGVCGQAEHVVRILVPLDTEPARSSVTLQVADRRFLDNHNILALHHFEIAQIAAPSVVAVASLMTSLGIVDASSVIGTERILLILIETGCAVRRALLLATQSRERDFVSVGRVAITHGIARIVVCAR